MKRMMIKPIASLLFGMAWMAAAGAVHGDVVILKSGEMLHTRKAWTQGGQVHLYQNERIVRFDLDDVERVVEETVPYDRGSTDGRPTPDASSHHHPHGVRAAPPNVAEPAGDTGYRGFQWGMPPAQIKGRGWAPMGSDPAYGGVEEVVLVENGKRFGSARVDRIRLGFWQDGLYTIVVEVSNFLDFRALKTEAFRRYGKGLQRQANTETFHWIDTVADRLLVYDVDTDAGYLWMRSRLLHSRVEAAYPIEP